MSKVDLGTSGGIRLTPEMVDNLAAEAEAGYDPASLKPREIKVLDFGYVRYIDHMGDDERIVRAARQSTDGAFRGWDRDENFLDFLYRQEHAGPFETGSSLLLEVQAPLMVFREWYRHRTFSYSEMSGRYVKMPDLYYVPTEERIQAQDPLNKQGSVGEVPSDVRDMFLTQVRQQQESFETLYSVVAERGVAREIARLNMPLAHYSRMWVDGKLRNWFAFLKLRMDKRAQYEIRQFANAVAQVVKSCWPRAYSLFEEYDLYGVRMSRTEMGYIREMFRSLPTPEVETLKQRFGKSRAREFLAKMMDDEPG